MWEKGCSVIKKSVCTVMHDTYEIKGNVTWRYVRPVGTAFLVAVEPFPILLTCAHVVVDGHGKPWAQIFLICNFVGPEVHVPRFTGANIMDVNLDLDLALIRGGDELLEATGPVGFASSDLLAQGALAAAMGFPSQSKATIYGDGTGETEIRVRLATGVVSASEVPVRLPQTTYTLLDLHHYELNMFAYPGMSGAPLFDLTGAVTGIVRGTKLHEEHVAAYCWADRNREVMEYLSSRKIKFASPKQG